MEPEQSQADSDLSLVGRLAGVLSPEAEQPVPEKAEPEVESPMGDQPEDDAEPEASEPELADFTDDDGTVYKIPAALADKIPLRADYTRKTQQAATLAEAANDRLQYAEAREQFMASVMSEVAEVQALKSQMKQYDGFDLSSLYSSDPGTAMRIRDQREDLRRQIQEKEQAINAKARNLEDMTNAHNSKQWELAVDGVKKRLGSISKETDIAMERRAQELGFTPKELRGRYADPPDLGTDPRLGRAQANQLRQDECLGSGTQGAPDCQTRGNYQSSSEQEQALRSRLKKSGDYRDAARLLLMRGK